MTLGLTFLLCLNGKFFDFKKTPFRYWFSVAINAHSCETAGKGVSVQGEITVQTL